MKKRFKHEKGSSLITKGFQQAGLMLPQSTSKNAANKINTPFSNEVRELDGTSEWGEELWKSRLRMLQWLIIKH